MKILVWLILCLIWGTTWIFIKVGLEDLPPFSFAAIRFVLAIIIVGAVLVIGKIPFPRTASQWRLLAVTGVLQFSLNYSFVFWSEQYITSGLASVLQATIPIFGLVMAWYYLPQEKITWLKFAAILLGVAGVALIFIEQLQIESLLAFVGCLLIIFGSYSAAHASILIKAKGGEMHPAALVFGQMVCGVLPIIVVAFVTEGNPMNFHYSWLTILSILYLTILGTVVTFWLYYWLLSKVESTKAMTIALVTPLIAVVCGSVFLGEEFPPQTIFGGVLILSSVGLIVFRKKNPKLKNLPDKKAESIAG